MSSLYQTELYAFLQEHKIEKGDTYTHTAIGKPAGSFNIPADAKPKLLDLLYTTIFQNGIPVSLTEKPPRHTIVKADLDFKFPLEESGRKYTLDHIRQIVELYHKAIQHYMEVDAKEMHAFVFERDAPYKDKGNTKDGLHIMYPYIVCDTDIQHLIREHVILNGQSVLSQLRCKNGIDDIVDKSVISTNNWLMYGCSKPGNKPYQLTHIYDAEYNDLNIRRFDPKTLLNLLSIRDHDENHSKPIRGEHKYLLEKKTASVAKVKRTIKTTIMPSSGYLSGDINLDEVRDLVKILSAERADNYRTWIEVGWCLHNISPSLLDSWIDFSKKSEKFVPGECESQWVSFDSRDDGLGIGSLHRWAKLDNLKEYQLFTRNSIGKDMLKSQSQTTQDIARVVYNMNAHRSNMVHGTNFAIIAGHHVIVVFLCSRRLVMMWLTNICD